MIEIIIFIAAVAVYLFASGILQIPGKDAKQIQVHRNKIPSWVRLVSLFVAAMMLVNILFRLFGG